MCSFEGKGGEESLSAPFHQTLNFLNVSLSLYLFWGAEGRGRVAEGWPPEHMPLNMKDVDPGGLTHTHIGQRTRALFFFGQLSLPLPSENKTTATSQKEVGASSRGDISSFTSP